VASGYSLDVDLLTSDTDAARTLVGTTCVPVLKQAKGWPYVHYEYEITDEGCTYTATRLRAENLYCLYKDPTVVPVPARTARVGSANDPQAHALGYLMIMVRSRVFEAEGLLTNGFPSNPSEADFDARILKNASGDLKPYLLPGTCYADIVCFWANDPAFQTGVKGPFSMVGARYALSADDGPHVRAWLGVPGATWIHTEGELWLYVYYVVEPNVSANPANDLEQVPSGCDGTAVASAESEIDAGEVTMAFERCIAVRRFRWIDIMAEIGNVPQADVVPEVDWTSGTAWTGPVRGESLGPVMLLAYGGAVPTGRFMDFREFLSGARTDGHAGHAGIPADPMPLMCGPNLSLYFSVIQDIANVGDIVTGEAGRRRASGHGIWRARAIPAYQWMIMDDGHAVTVSVDGLAFVVDGNAATAPADVLSHDQITASQGTNRIDPDPVLMPDGSVRVFHGEDFGALTRVDGSPDVACLTAGDLSDDGNVALWIVAAGPHSARPWPWQDVEQIHFRPRAGPLLRARRRGKRRSQRRVR
jgi:hypothetical protein